MGGTATQAEKTIPIYNPNGTIMGYTSPEGYAALGNSTALADALAANPDLLFDNYGSTYTGFNDDSSVVRLYDPVEGDFDNIETNGDWKAFNPSSDNTMWAYTPEGDRVLSQTPPEGYIYYQNLDPNYEGVQFGYTPEVDWNYRELSLGPGDKMNADGTFGVDPGQPPPAHVPGDNPFIVDDTAGQTGGGGGAGGGGGTTGGGGGAGGGGFVTDPTDPYQNGYGGPTINWGDPTGTQNISAGGNVDTPFDIDPFNPANHFGFENSTNEDFYQIQAAAQRAQTFRNAMREQNARNKANNPPAVEQTDPWAWAGGSDQFAVGGGSGGGTGGSGGGTGGSNEWYMNPNYTWEPGVTTNAQLLQMYSTLPAFDNYDINAWLGQNHPSQTSTNWGKFQPNNGNPNPFINGNPMVDTLFQNMWLQDNAPANPYGGNQNGG